MSALKESLQSRLRPLRSVVEEFAARREAGMNHFGKEEMAVTRLVNILDDLLNTDTCETGGLLLFLRQAVRDTLPYATLTHKPLEKVGERGLTDALDGSRFWIVCALNMTGALKETLQRTFEASDIMHAYYLPHAIVHHQEFKVEFLQLLTLLTMPMSANSVTTFDLDITALQCFYPRSTPVSFSRRKTQNKSGGSDVGLNNSSLVSHSRHHRHHKGSKETSEVGVSSTTGGGGDDDRDGERRKDIDGRKHRSHHRHSGRSRESSKHRSREGESAQEISTQTVLEGKHILVKDTATIEGDDDLAGMILAGFDEDPDANDAEVHAAAFAKIANSQASSPGRKFTRAESWAQTDKPSPSISFAEFCRMEQEQKQREQGIREREDKVKKLEAQWKEANEDIESRLEAVLKTLNLTKSLYNEAYVTRQEAMETGTDLTPESIHPLIPKILAVVFSKAQVVPAGTPLLTRAASSRNDVAGGGSEISTPTNRGAGGPLGSAGPKSSSDVASATDNAGGQASSTMDYDARTSRMFKQEESFVDIGSEDSFTGPPKKQATTTGGSSSAGSPIGGDAPSNSTFDLQNLLSKANQADVGALARTSDNRDLRIGEDVPPAKPVGNLHLIVSMPVEKEREAQLRVQSNTCASCDTKFPSQGSNLMTKMVSKTASALTMQKPRRCHYCGALFCHKCHTNKTIILPFRVFQRWDFTPQHVCNNCFEFLSANFDRPLYSLKSLPRELSQRPSILQITKLRTRLMAVNRVVSQCRDALKDTTLAAIIHSHFFTREDYFSVADFTRIRASEGSGKLNLNLPSLLGGSANEDLMGMLTSMYKKMKTHALECRICHARSSARCLICMDLKPVLCFEDDGTKCPKCGTIYHKGCLDAMRCKKCAEDDNEFA